MTSIASIQYDGDPSSAVLKSNGNNTTTTLDASLEQTKTTIEQSEEVPNTQPLTDQKMCEEPSGTEYLGQQSSAAAEKDDNSWGILKALTPELETIRLTKSADGTGSSDNGSKGYLLGRHR
ncbi:hypothetical protein HK102_012459 [Quaeritorhiza haematococci]|nr:hypothetical protein HK102_012459 [Quaeritorhiza haematococci]